VADLRNSAKYPDSPDDTRLTSGCEGINGYGDNYGARVSGFFTPSAGGNYTFYIAADDNAELWVSLDDMEENLQLVATEPVYAANPREWTGNVNRPGCDLGDCENISSPIALQAGQSYYLELLYKEGAGGDHGAVKAVLEGQPDPVNGDPPMAGPVLSTAVSAATLQAIALPRDLMSPIGSANTPGFCARGCQADQGTKTIGLANSSCRAETQLAGFLTYLEGGSGAVTTANAADLTGAVNGVFTIPTVINWNQDYATAEIGNFQSTSTPSNPDQPIPGIPGLGTADHNTDNLAGEAITYVEFTAPGVYTMGVNSDDGFKVTASDTPPAHYSALEITAPTASVRAFYTFWAPWESPLGASVSGKLVLTDPIVACQTGNTPQECAITLNNADQVRGNIAVCDRGVGRFDGKALSCLRAGALACLILNNRDGASGEGIWVNPALSGERQNLPTALFSRPDGDVLKNLLQQGEVTVTLTPDSTRTLGLWEGDRGSADTLFTFHVPQAGVYPFRCIWYEGGSGANLEWFSVNASGQKVLLNDTAAAGSLRTYQARVFAPQPTLKLTQLPNLTWQVEYVGILLSSDMVTGPYTPVAGATSPYPLNTAAAAAQFYRAQRPGQ
jgi:hypothetical protein